MLILTRKLSEALVIGGCIRVCVASIAGKQARLAIEAPDRVSILRSEIRGALRRPPPSDRVAPPGRDPTGELGCDPDLDGESRTRLVLTRKLDESILIGGIIRVAVVSLGGKQVRLGIEAPDRISILREELCGPASDPAPAPGRTVPTRGAATPIDRTRRTECKGPSDREAPGRSPIGGERGLGFPCPRCSRHLDGFPPGP